MIKIRYYPEREGRKGKRVIKGVKREGKSTPTLTLEKAKVMEVSEDDYIALEQNATFKSLVDSTVIDVTKPQKKSTTRTTSKSKTADTAKENDEP